MSKDYYDILGVANCPTLGVGQFIKKKLLNCPTPSVGQFMQILRKRNRRTGNRESWANCYFQCMNNSAIA